MPTEKLKIGFLGSPDFAADILSFIVAKELAIVKAVWTNPEKKTGRGQKIQKTKVQLVAEQNNIKVQQVKTFAATLSEQIKLIHHLNIDLLFVIAYGQILPETFFKAPRYGSINLHFSLLPLYRGASPLQQSILNGDSQSGVTLQQIATRVDQGDILLQKTFGIENCNSQEVFAKSIEATKTALLQFFANQQNYFEQKISQLDILAQKKITASYCQKINKEDGKITKEDTTIIVKRKFLAYYLWPKVFFYFEQNKYILEEIELISTSVQTLQEKYRLGNWQAGFLYPFENKLLLVLADCNRDAILIEKIKKSGKKTISAKDFLNGCRWQFPVEIDL